MYADNTNEMEGREDAKVAQIIDCCWNLSLSHRILDLKCYVGRLLQFNDEGAKAWRGFVNGLRLSHTLVFIVDFLSCFSKNELPPQFYSLSLIHAQPTTQQLGGLKWDNEYENILYVTRLIVDDNKISLLLSLPPSFFSFLPLFLLSLKSGIQALDVKYSINQVYFLIGYRKLEFLISIDFSCS